MSEHPNATRIRNAYAAYAEKDVPTVLAEFDPGVLFHVGGAGPMTGTHKGHEGVMAVIGHSLELSGGTQRLDVRGVYADDTHAVVHVHETATRAADSVALDVQEVHLLLLGTDGRIVDFRDLPADPEAHDAFFDGR